MHGEEEELVHRHSVLPPFSQGRLLLITGQDPLQMRQPEQLKHRQIRLPVPSMSSRVNQHRTLLGMPEYIPAPEVTVDQRGRLILIQLPGSDPLTGCSQGSIITGTELGSQQF